MADDLTQRAIAGAAEVATDNKSWDRAVAEVRRQTQGGTMEPMTKTIGQVADMLQISQLTVRRMWQRGEFVAPVSLGRVIRWRTTDVENWLASRATSELYESKAQ